LRVADLVEISHNGRLEATRREELADCLIGGCEACWEALTEVLPLAVRAEPAGAGGGEEARQRSPLPPDLVALAILRLIVLHHPRRHAAESLRMRPVHLFFARACRKRPLLFAQLLLEEAIALLDGDRRLAAPALKQAYDLANEHLMLRRVPWPRIFRCVEFARLFARGLAGTRPPGYHFARPLKDKSATPIDALLDARAGQILAAHAHAEGVYDFAVAQLEERLSHLAAFPELPAAVRAQLASQIGAVLLDFRPHRARPVLQQAHDLLPQRGSLLRARVLHQLVRAAAIEGELPEAARRIKQHAYLWRRFPDPAIASDHHWILALAARLAGRLPSAVRHARKALDYYLETRSDPVAAVDLVLLLRDMERQLRPLSAYAAAREALKPWPEAREHLDENLPKPAPDGALYHFTRAARNRPFHGGF